MSQAILEATMISELTAGGQPLPPKFTCLYNIIDRTSSSFKGAPRDVMGLEFLEGIIFKEGSKWVKYMYTESPDLSSEFKLGGFESKKELVLELLESEIIRKHQGEIHIRESGSQDLRIQYIHKDPDFLKKGIFLDIDSL